jgi:hypothetical protein
MKGVWVKKRYPIQYLSRRHFFEDDGWIREAIPVVPVSWGGTKWEYTQSMCGKSLCGRRMSYHGVDFKNPFTGRVHIKGALSIRKKVRLTQRNLCYHCLIKYMRDQPRKIRQAFYLLYQLR